MGKRLTTREAIKIVGLRDFVMHDGLCVLSRILGLLIFSIPRLLIWVCAQIGDLECYLPLKSVVRLVPKRLHQRCRMKLRAALEAQEGADRP